MKRNKGREACAAWSPVHPHLLIVVNRCLSNFMPNDNLIVLVMTIVSDDAGHRRKLEGALAWR